LEVVTGELAVFVSWNPNAADLRNGNERASRLEKPKEALMLSGKRLTKGSIM
jgi:hypothetical protein